MSEELRTKFEAWANEQKLALNRHHHSYAAVSTAWCWDAWRAALSAQPPADELRDMEARKDAAYLERNQVVAALARAYPSGVARTAIEGWSDDWHGCVYIDLPTGQASWHFHDSQAYLFDGLPQYSGKWDGHDTPEKYRRLAALKPQPPAPSVPGWQWVPVKVCAAMNQAADKVPLGDKESGQITLSWDEYEAIYAAMLSAAPPPVPSVPDGLTFWQFGMNNAAMLEHFRKKLPGVEPTDRELSAFAVGSEVGFEHARDLERQDWSRVWHALARAGLHPGRTDDRAEAVIDRLVAERDALAAKLNAPPPVRERLTDEQILAEAEKIDNEPGFLAGFYQGFKTAERALIGGDAQRATGEAQ